MKSVKTTELRRDLDVFAQVVGSGRAILVTNHGKGAFGMVPAEWSELIDRVLQFDHERVIISESEWKAVLGTGLKETLAAERPSLALVIKNIIEAAVVIQRYQAMDKQSKGK